MKDTADHPASYYVATANRHTDYPRLSGEHHCDVAVVGAGYTGLSAALFLAERGYAVSVVEARRTGWGASGRNGGQLIDGFVETDKIEKRLGARAAEIAWQMGLECRDIVIQRIEQYSIDCDLKLGYLDLAEKRSEMQRFRSEIERKRRLGYPHAMRMVERDELSSVVGSPLFVGGMINAANGHLHPLNLCLGEARAIEQHGGRIFERSPVLRIEHGDRPKLHTADGVVHARKVVLAGNAYLGRTEPRIFGQVIPAGSYMIATERLNDELAGELLPQDHAACNQKIVLDYFRLSADKRMLFGGFCNYSGRDPRDITASLRPKLVRVFPQLKKVRVEFEWGGNIGISINRIPQLGRIEGNTYYAQGYSGHGLAPTHMAGKVIADAIGGDFERFDVFERIHHWRLPGGKWFANPALAVGMLYYRLKDLL
jgi:glycine/D-amino acid oxidase-like deaminating enzyme